MVRSIRSHLPYLGLVVVLYILLAVCFAYINGWYNPPISTGSDLNVHIPRAYKLVDPRLFSRDPGFQTFGWDSFGRLDTLLFPLLLSKLFPLLGGFRATLIVLSVILGMVFVLGVYWLTVYLFGDGLAGVIAALLASFNYGALGGVQLGFLPNEVYPRNFIVAVSPIVIVLFLRWKSSKALWGLYALLGVMANFHILAAAHLALMLTLSLIIDSGLSWSLLKRVLIGAIGFVFCALPVILTFLPSVRGRVTVTSDEAFILRARYDFVIRPSLEDFLILVVTFAPIAVLAGVSLYRVSRRQDGQRGILRAYLSLCLVVLLLPWVGTLINALTLSFMQLELLRFTRYYFALGLAPAAMLLASWMKKGSQGRSPSFTLLAVICLTGTMVLSRPQVGKLIVLRGLDRIESGSESTAPASDSAEYPTMVRDWRAFSELSEWVDSNTPVDALFLAPVDWSEFRVYARRGMVVSWKATWWEQWGEHYMTVYDLYGHPDAQKFVKVAKDYEVDYVVVMRGLDLPDFDVVYENSFYVVYKVE